MRGLGKCRGEFSLMTLSYNLKRVMNELGGAAFAEHAGKSSGWGRLGCDIALEATDSYALTSIPETLLAAARADRSPRRFFPGSAEQQLLWLKIASALHRHAVSVSEPRSRDRKAPILSRSLTDGASRAYALGNAAYALGSVCEKHARFQLVRRNFTGHFSSNPLT